MAFHSSRYSYLDEQGNPRGVTTALVRAVAEQMGWDVEFFVMPYLRGIQKLRAGQVDMLYALEVEGTTTRVPSDVMTAIEPVYRIPISVYALASRDIDIDSFAQAQPYKIGMMRIAPIEDRSFRDGQLNFYYFESDELLTKALKARHVDLMIMEPGSVLTMGNELKMQLQRLFDYTYLSYYPIFSRRSPRLTNPMALCRAYVKALTQVVDSGLYLHTLEAYGLGLFMPYYHNVVRGAGDCRSNHAEGIELIKD